MKEQKEQPVQLIVQNCPTEEDEIDLRELWHTIKRNKKVVYVTTALFFILALIYIFLKTPLYEAKALLEIGYIGDKPIESAEVVAQKIKTAFFVDDPRLRSKMDKEAFVQDANPVKKVKKLIKITTYGTSNEKAVNKAKEVVEFVQKDEALKIAQFKKETQAQIDKISRDIEKLKLIDVKKIEDKIALLKLQDLKKIDDQIKLIKEQNLKKIEDKIKLIKEQDLKKINDQIEIYKNDVIPNILSKIKIATQQIEKFEKNIENLQKSINASMDKAFVALTLVQISNYQNMIYSRQLKINDLKLQKEKILKETIPNLERQKERILKETIPNLERQKERILKETIPNLERQKERILKETIPNLERQKEQILKIQIPKLKDQIEALRYKLTPAYISTTKPVGDIQTYDKPAKPKKKLILIVALVTGAILGIFLVFFLEFLRNEEKEEQ